MKKVCWLIAALMLWLPSIMQAATATSISQYGITWTFDQAHEVGQYVNGDWWVQGPVTITAVAPAPVFMDSVVVHKLNSTTATLRNVWLHGSVLNPMAGAGSGYDSRVSGFNSTLRASFPLPMTSGQSLVSSISNLDSLSGNSYEAPILTAAALTVVAAPPDSLSFRPPFCGAVYKPCFSAAQLRRDLLPNVAPVIGMPSLAAYERKFQRIWLDHYTGWTGRALHPYQNMSNYGREICGDVSNAAMLLMCNTYTDKLLINYIQVGIDLYGILKSGGGFYADGGHMAGRKWPILFAGLMLDDAELKAVGTNYGKVYFQEDQMTFYVTRHPDPAAVWTFNGTYWVSDSTDEDYDIFIPNPAPALDPVPSNFDSAGYRMHIGWGFTYYGHANANKEEDYAEYVDKHAGLPEWELARGRGGLDWSAAYRNCGNGEAYPGFILAANMVPGARALWNHEAVFDYTDRFAAIEGPSSAFVRTIWKAYRTAYGCTWTRDDTTDMYSNGRPDCSRCVHNCPTAIGHPEQKISGVRLAGDQVAISPNPAEDILTITAGRSALIEIYSSAGILVKKTLAASSSTAIRTSDLKPGIYLLHITLNNKKWTNKIMITRRY